MLLPTLLRNVFARLFSRLSFGGFPALDPLRRPCPATPRFRPTLEMLECRMMPSVTVNYTSSSGLLVVNATSSAATGMTVSQSTNNQVTLVLTGDGFSLQGNATTPDFVLTGTKNLTIYTGSAPLANFDITQRSNSEPLTFGLGATTSGVTNVSISGVGDAVTFNAVNITGSLTATSGTITLSSNNPITTGGAVTLTGLGVGTGNNSWGVKIASTLSVGNNNITITGTGSGSGTGNNYGVLDTMA